MTVTVEQLSSTDLWRLFNVVLAVVALTLATYRLRKHWAFLKAGRLVVMSLMVFEAATVYGSVEQIVQGTPFGFRIMLGTVANFWAIIAFLHTPTGAPDESA